VHAVTLTGKFSGLVLTATGIDGTEPTGLNTTFMSWPWLFAGPQPSAELGLPSEGGDTQVMCMSAKYNVPSGAKAKPYGV
jgi:hypothetical protein